MAAVSLFVFCGAVKAQQQADDTQTVEVCAVQLLTGGYGYSFSGFSGPFATTTTFLLGEGRVGAVGLATFDGAGGLIARDPLASRATAPIKHTPPDTTTVTPNATAH